MSYYKVPYGKAVNAFFTVRTPARGSLGSVPAAQFKVEGGFAIPNSIYAGQVFKDLQVHLNDRWAAGLKLPKTNTDGRIGSDTMKLLMGAVGYAGGQAKASSYPVLKIVPTTLNQAASLADEYLTALRAVAPSGPSASSVAASAGSGILSWLVGKAGASGSASGTTTVIAAPGGGISGTTIALAAVAFGAIYYFGRRKR